MGTKRTKEEMRCGYREGGATVAVSKGQQVFLIYFCLLPVGSNWYQQRDAAKVC